MKIHYATMAIVAGVSVLCSSCVAPAAGYVSYSAPGSGISTGVAWTNASYDADGFPIFGYSYGRPVYGYTAAGAAIFTIGALTALCYVPHWGPASWYHGHHHYPVGIHRVPAPPRYPAGHAPHMRPAAGAHKGPGMPVGHHPAPPKPAVSRPAPPKPAVSRPAPPKPAVNRPAAPRPGGNMRFGNNNARPGNNAAPQAPGAHAPRLAGHSGNASAPKAPASPNAHQAGKSPAAHGNPVTLPARPGGAPIARVPSANVGRGSSAAAPSRSGNSGFSGARHGAAGGHRFGKR